MLQEKHHEALQIGPRETFIWMEAGAEPETIGRGARIKKIKCLGHKKHHFLLHEFYFSANQGSARAPVGTYLDAATGWKHKHSSN
jgi:hypothetical protein